MVFNFYFFLLPRQRFKVSLILLLFQFLTLLPFCGYYFYSINNNYLYTHGMVLENSLGLSCSFIHPQSGEFMQRKLSDNFSLPVNEDIAIMIHVQNDYQIIPYGLPAYTFIMCIAALALSFLAFFIPFFFLYLYYL